MFVRGLLLGLAATCLFGQASFIVVRHAERDGAMTGDVPLTEAGRCRAERLASMLAESRISAVYTTELVRTQQTAAPLVKKLGLQPQVVAAKDLDGLIARLKGEKGRVLVVGHSNTVPTIVSKLGGGAVTEIGETEYDRMYVVSGGEAMLVRYSGCGR